MIGLKLDLDPRGHVQIEHVVNGPIETNTYFVISGDEAVVIDPAWEGERLATSFAERHPNVTIKAMVCTHGHADHTGGVAGMRRSLGADARYLLPAADAGIVAGSIAHQKHVWGIDSPDPGVPDVLISEGDTVAVGDVVLQVVSVPGHTSGGVVLFAATEDGNIAFVGDTLFPGSHGRTDLEGGDEGAIISSLAKMATLLPPDTLCLTGHGSATTIADELVHNPFFNR